jgi:regulatory protein
MTPSPKPRASPLDAALRFLSYRPRSEAEVRRRLLKAYPPQKVEKTLHTLKDRGLLDDDAFARFWRENRDQHRPRSKTMIRQELFRLGVDRQIIEETLEDLDEDEAALSAGRKILRRLRNADFPAFKARMEGHLRRRGFGYRVASEAVQRLWEELSNPGDSDVDGEAQVQKTEDAP